MELENQQVMGPHADKTRMLVPKFKYDGGNLVVFKRDFPVVASASGVTEVYQWGEDKEMNEEETKKNTVAQLVLRQY